ncbi:hypothetical protein N836_18050 [Leptolyngbya sp. Heron Island J]|uniref:hypothetical protein n=1 Tax=Leptolyngbya sp. Heron Island J TaxID=1385935 RepID=UPI0003B9864A|nr:hypothetical protein [Leptolyngbya sp. Heron Island J]ESA34151.1 hypothetical protein N836_18050 [Leptolyngbya sp. Heron Island J]
MKLRGVESDVLAIATALGMAFFTPNLSSQKLVSGVLSLLSIVLGSSPSLAQLPELPTPTPSASTAAPKTPTSPEQEQTETTFIRPQTSCPTDLDSLSKLLIRDIPSYTNRILQSSVADIPTAYRPAYVIAASQPDQVPLEIRDRVYTTLPDSSEQLRQLFFTTLERQYSGLEATAINHFHWLFLAPDDMGWRMVFMFSAIAAGDDAQIPPRDSSQGSVGQAVQQWLRDCRAEAIFPE